MHAADLLEPDKLWRAAEVLTRPCPVPAVPGLYGWHFERSPHPRLPAGRLLYVGIAPRRMATRTSKQNLRTRVRYHFRGNAEGSTLRLTLGCLLGLELRRVGSGKRLTFRQAGERELTAWMAENARVCWLTHPEPWIAESELITSLDLPLNLDQNRDHVFHRYLSDLRASARTRARELPITS
ncbi:GIY-YIG nuclease family protein [Streptosporangium sp. NPDC004379]|uniref:GIY-YIG nuclease family protein n=1 Tax=Streptosporangium sp. NPDC004379 TaxID=3366189 RepID=UPI003696BE9C